MTAIATLRRPHWRGPHSPRHGVSKILRGAAWKAGWVLAAHNDRLMPYPVFGYSGTFAAALTIDKGGPLQVTSGADSILMISSQPGTTWQYNVGGTAPVVTIAGSGTGSAIVVTGPTTATMATIYQALLAHAGAAKVGMFSLAGTGAATIGAAAAPAAVPFVRIYGVAKADVDNSADLINDALLPLGSPEESCGDAGIYGLEMAEPGTAPGPAWLVDNQTVTFIDSNSLYLPLPCRSIEDDLAFCDLAVGYR